MRVVRNFENVYQSEDDPWAIGDASSDRYNKYIEIISPHIRGSVLDIGCGMGALLARVRDNAQNLEGVELSRTAIEKGAKRFPFITFHLGSAAALHLLPQIHGKRFDFIICSDVICYLKDHEKDALVEWIASHLSPNGKALIAGWSPGGKYPTPSELKSLAQRHCNVLHSEYFEGSGHLALLVAKKRRVVALTIDYETWHPIPQGKHIDWDVDVFQPTERLFELFEKTGVAATFFAEMGEYFWLCANKPEIAQRMEEQWRQAVSRGHDVQLHLHSCWLPETGAALADGNWHWDWSKAKADSYPGDLTTLIGRCKQALEAAIRPVRADYSVTCFRAGAYQAQPFERLSRALVANGIICDSSVFPNGKSSERDFDYSHPYTRGQPYFADPFDPQLRATPSEEEIIELPIFTPELGRRWFIDGNEGRRLADRLIRYESEMSRPFSIVRTRAMLRVRQAANTLYSWAAPYRKFVNRVLPRRVAHALIAHHNPVQTGDLCYVAIGHTKADLELPELERNLVELMNVLNVEYVTISDMARTARAHLWAGRRKTAGEEIAYQVKRETPVVLGEARNDQQSFHLQEMIPLDIERVLDFGCGAGCWSARIAELYPWVEVTGVDAGAEFITKAKRSYADKRVKFEVGDFENLSYADATFDCVYADNTLEHSFDLERAFSEIRRVLRPGGSLVAAVPADGLNPDEDCDNHTWKTVHSQVAHRLERAGFSNFILQQVDTYRELGMPPYLPSLDQMLYVRAWKLDGGDDPLKRALRAMDWVYHHVSPCQPNLSLDPAKIISDGYAYCIGYAIALGGLLKREGYSVTWVTMLADGHPRGSGPRRTDSHQVIEVNIKGQRYILDPMANTCIPHSLDQLLLKPQLADDYANRDDRCKERGYDLYNTSFWYERVARFAIRRNTRIPIMLWKRRLK